MRTSKTIKTFRARYDGWLIISVTFLASGLMIGTSNYAFGLFIEPLESSFGWGRTAISASLSFMAVGSLTGPIIGRAMDLFGARYVMAPSLLLFGFSFLMRPFIQELKHFYFLSFLQFAALPGATELTTGRLVGIWFPHSRGRAMGFATMGNNFGGLTMPLLVGLVLANSASWFGQDTTGEDAWKTAFFIIAIISVVLAIMASFLVHENPILPSQSPRTFQSHDDLGGWSVKQTISTRGFYAMAAAMTLSTFTYSTILPHIGAHLETEGLPDNVVLTSVALLAIFGMVGKLLFGYVAERITSRRALMLTLTGQCLSILLIVITPSQPLIWISVPMYGLFMGSYGVLSTLLVQESYGLKSFGSISGLVGITSVLSLISGPLIAGISADKTGGYGLAFVGIVAMFGLAIFALRLVPKPLITTSFISQ